MKPARGGAQGIQYMVLNDELEKGAAELQLLLGERNIRKVSIRYPMEGEKNSDYKKKPLF